jgi:uncharacterized protein (DUF433 family)
MVGRTSTTRTFSLKEAAAIAGLPEAAVRREIERGVLRPLSRRRGRRRTFAFGPNSIVYLTLRRELTLDLDRKDRASLYRIIADNAPDAGGWVRDGARLRNGPVTIDLSGPQRTVSQRLRDFEAGRKRVVSDPAVLGGEPVFSGTRLSVRHIGRLADRGTPVEEILADHPALGRGDVRFAAMFARMKPDPGRPRRRLAFRRETA